MAHFDEARRAALMGDLLAHLTGRPANLLAFDRVREHLKLSHLVDRGVLEVPLDRIVGTVGREKDFNRTFLPRGESLRARWEEVEGLAEGPAGFPSVELYKVGEAYFVVDGHHRVSVARSLEAPAIEAHVKEFETPVPLDAGASIEDVVLKSGLVDFLEATRLAPEEPDEFRTTVPNGYERLLEHVGVHRYFRGIDDRRECPWDEAVRSWRLGVYRPMVATIRESGVLAEFPGCTETDLYLFTMDHLHHLRERYAARAVEREAAVRHFRWFGRSPAGGKGRLRSWWRRIVRGRDV
ncbi:MAG: hypothetical protein LAO51_00510 [Acidobacteriia bacterium]|nr:hypothetical protein [Terriglobia bacterium]